MKNKKSSSIKKWTNRDYHVQYNKDVYHQGVKINCVKNHFPALQFLVTHNKPYGVRGICKNYLIFFPQTST